MEHIILQVLPPQEWVALFGPLGALLVMAVIYQAREIKTKDKALAELNEAMRKDGLSNMKIIEGLIHDLRIKYEHDKQTADKLDKILDLLHHKTTQ